MFEYESKTLFSRSPEAVKLGVMLLLSASAVLVYSLDFQLTVFALALSLLLLSGFNDFRKLLGTLLPILLLANFGIYLFFSNIEPTYYLRMLIITLRLSAMYLSFAFFLRVTNLFALVGWMRRIGLPEPLYLALYIALRFLPEVEREFHTVRAAQKMRGRTLNPITASVGVILPMLYVLFDRADELSIAYYLRKRSGRI